MRQRRSTIITFTIALTLLLLGLPVTVLAQTLTLSLDPTSITGGYSSNGKIGLSGPAPADGFVVQLSSSNPAVATVPASATAGGKISFTVTTVPVAQSFTVIITATSGGVSKTAYLTVVPPVPSSVTLAPRTIVGGQSATGQVSLTGPPPAGALVVQLSSSNATVVTVPTSVTVPAGATTASFTVTTVPVAQSTNVGITATASGGSRYISLTVVPPVPSAVSLAPTSVQGGQTSTGQVSLSGQAPAGGRVVQLSSSSNTAVQTLPASVTVAAGATTASFLVKAAPVRQATLVTITATADGVSKTAQLAVNP